MTIAVIAPAIGAESAVLLARKLKGVYINPYQTGQQDFRAYDGVINYGFSQHFLAKRTLNKPENVEKSRDKRTTLSLLTEASPNLCVPFTKSSTVARGWLLNGSRVVAREKAKSSQGKGIKYCSTLEQLNSVEAKFYTRYTPSTHEFRVTLFQDKVIGVYTKELIDDEGVTKFQFLPFKGVEAHPQLAFIAHHVYTSIGLDWCGIDVLRTNNGDLKLLEVNSAPILCDEDVSSLVKAIKEVWKR